MITVDKFNYKGKRVLVRVDFNVPLDEHKNVTDDTRIKAALPTINKIVSDGGKAVLMSHLGRPKGKDNAFSLKPVADYLATKIEAPVYFSEETVGEKAIEVVDQAEEGSVILLENVRFYAEETKGDLAFATQLAQLGDCYVNDAFGTAHRAHASTTVVAGLFVGKSAFGYLIAKELESLDKIFSSGQKPVAAVVGGAKVSSKISILENLLDKVDRIFIGGGMAFTFVKAQGGKVGSSLIEDDYIPVAEKVIMQAKEKNVELLLPVDAIIADDFNNDANRKEADINSIPDGWMGLDIGEKSISLFKEKLLDSNTILWNGPMGVFEFENFAKGTVEVALSIADSTSKGAFSVVGGGDSVAAVNKFKLGDRVSHVSTGGGAMLECLEGKILPGIAAIKETSH
ncbi:phosphoglycerate kinase [Luteibaculum oceani]|uniref:Phosphoglycerate kinase n=1 Tax=Luteibaculum oceani TaxID=1294296 RepID=A0A5C6VJE7_9FLAO|nr:phosphoglycerate kinase [Luteibaculum oceani]TXC85417.1 phosphoglycerate kinase [Luteibaculum oceani]